jgi:hypothetical protein
MLPLFVVLDLLCRLQWLLGVFRRVAWNASTYQLTRTQGTAGFVRADAPMHRPAAHSCFRVPGGRGRQLSCLGR